VKFRRPVSLNPRINDLIRTNTAQITALFSLTKTPLLDEMKFVSLNPEEIVQQCSLTMQYLFKQIPSQEFLSHHYSDPAKCPNIISFARFKDRVSSRPASSSLLLLADSLQLQSYFVNEILRYNSVLDRVKVIAQLLRCVSYASLCSNLELIEVIYSSLTLQPVYRLTKTFQLVQQSHPSEYEGYWKLTNPYCKPLRERSSNCSPPAIPCIAHYAKEIHMSSQTPQWIEIEPMGGEEGVKHLALGELKAPLRAQLAIERFQAVPYLFRFDEKIQRDVVNCRLYLTDETALLVRSLSLQPE
jgi:hypothetical protein